MNKNNNIQEFCVVTGAAGFIGFHVVMKFLKEGKNIIGIDNLNNYYDKKLKIARLDHLIAQSSKIEGSTFKFYETDINDFDALSSVFSSNMINDVCHLAAQAGVRNSLEKPWNHIQNNIVGTINVLEVMRSNDISNLVFASSSSVYGLNEEVPFTEDLDISKTISPYATSKRSAELLCYNYSHLYGIQVKVMRFFTVYGPWGRPDMAYYIFAKAIMEDKPLKIFNNGVMQRDFTCVDDICQGFGLALDFNCEYEIFNLGSGESVELMHFINLIEKNLGKEAKKEMYPLQPGDVVTTWSNIDKAKKLLGYEPKISLDEGLKDFIDWFLSYGRKFDF